MNIYDDKQLVSSVDVSNIQREFLRCPILSSKDKFIIKVPVEIVDIQGYWNPKLYRPKMQLDWSISFDSACNKNFPFITFFNQSGINQFTIALENQIDDIRFSANMNQADGTYDLVIEISNPRRLKDIGVLIDKRHVPWTKVVADYRKDIIADDQLQFPQESWQPAYCTWYARHRKLNQNWIEEAAQTAKEIGFGTFILDDGWSMESEETLTPKTLPNWYGPIGDWEICSQKIPDFKSHVEKVQNLGLNYMLWVAPFLIGNQSDSYKKYKSFCSDNNTVEGLSMLDPCQTDISLEIADELISLVDTYSLNGLKVDFIDSINNSIDSCGGSEIAVFLERLRKGLQGKMIEFRQSYSNLAALKYATQFRANDVPFDFIENLHRIAYLRIVLGDGVPIHSDPAYWNPNEEDDNIARHMIVSLTGVPMVSVDFEKTDCNSREIVKSWLDFYNQHIETFKTGKWDVSYNRDYVEFFKCSGDNESVVVVTDKTFNYNNLSADSQSELYILNLLQEPLFVNCHESFDCYCKPVKNVNLILPAGYGRIIT